MKLLLAAAGDHKFARSKLGKFSQLNLPQRASMPVQPGFVCAHSRRATSCQKQDGKVW
jgi:hypothetical protein